MDPHHYQPLQKPRIGVGPGWQGKALEGEGVDGELQAKRATPAPSHLWKQDDFSLKVTGRRVL